VRWRIVSAAQEGQHLHILRCAKHHVETAYNVETKLEALSLCGLMSSRQNLAGMARKPLTE
jgi:hypothetical protein